MNVNDKKSKRLNSLFNSYSEELIELGAVLDNAGRPWKSNHRFLGQPSQLDREFFDLSSQMAFGEPHSTFHQRSEVSSQVSGKLITSGKV